MCLFHHINIKMDFIETKKLIFFYHFNRYWWFSETPKMQLYPITTSTTKTLCFQMSAPGMNSSESSWVVKVYDVRSASLSDPRTCSQMLPDVKFPNISIFNKWKLYGHVETLFPEMSHLEFKKKNPQRGHSVGLITEHTYIGMLCEMQWDLIQDNSIYSCVPHLNPVKSQEAR